MLSRKRSNTISISFKHGVIKATIADSFIKRAIGLGFRRAIGVNDGMAFIFARPRNPRFWNVGMLFPIDVIWIRDGVIVHIQKNIPKMANGLKIFYSARLADVALEIQAGMADKIGATLYESVHITYSLEL